MFAPDPTAALPCTARAAIAFAMLGLHALIVFGLMQWTPARPAIGAPAPIFAELIVPAAPEPPKLALPPPPPPAATPEPEPAPRRRVIAAKKTARPTAPEFVAPPEPLRPRRPAEPAPAPSGMAPSAPPADSPPQPAIAAVASPPISAAPPAPAPSPAPKDLSIRAVQYLTLPVLRYPPASRRLLEEGRVEVRVLVDAGGAPRETVLVRSSGYPRLDDAALATVRATRFKPYSENGVAMPFWVVMPLIFELES